MNSLTKKVLLLLCLSVGCSEPDNRETYLGKFLPAHGYRPIDRTMTVAAMTSQGTIVMLVLDGDRWLDVGEPVTNSK